VEGGTSGGGIVEGMREEEGEDFLSDPQKRVVAILCLWYHLAISNFEQPELEQKMKKFSRELADDHYFLLAKTFQGCLGYKPGKKPVSFFFHLKK
jgi:hypothetical protein